MQAACGDRQWRQLAGGTGRIAAAHNGGTLSQSKKSLSTHSQSKKSLSTHSQSKKSPNTWLIKLNNKNDTTNAVITINVPLFKKMRDIMVFLRDYYF